MLKAMTRATAALALLYGVRRYYRNWGTTKEECRLWLPGDEFVRQPFVQSTEGVWIDAPPSAVWPWLNRIGGHRGDLTAGETVRLTPWPRRGEPSGASLSVEQVTEGRSLVLRVLLPAFPGMRCGRSTLSRAGRTGAGCCCACGRSSNAPVTSSERNLPGR